MHLRTLGTFLALSSSAIMALACASTPDLPPAVPLAMAAPEEPSVAHDGTLDLSSDPPTDVLVDGKPIGRTPITAFKVAPGNHDVTFVDPPCGNRTIGVTLEPGEGRTIKSDCPITAADSKRVGPAEPEKAKKN